MYDLIGDIHGHAVELVHLLEHLGYRRQGAVYSHPDRTMIFLGDFIDRGPKIREVLEIVRPMVLEGRALAVMGNHEWNALAYDTPDPNSPGKYLRRHTPKNDFQHCQTIQQLGTALNFYLDWFRTLPLWLELDGLRAIHACWDQESIDRIAPVLSSAGGVTSVFLTLACAEKDSWGNENSLFHAVEIILKGKEASLPHGAVFHDKDGHERRQIRTRWYLSPVGQTYRSYALQTSAVNCDHELDLHVISAAAPYPADGKPVFIGHYWLEGSHPALLADNVACLDYSVANKGFLCAYRWNGEQILSARNFVRVG